MQELWRLVSFSRRYNYFDMFNFHPIGLQSVVGAAHVLPFEISKSHGMMAQPKFRTVHSPGTIADP
jgi:hypothetical protein